MGECFDCPERMKKRGATPSVALLRQPLLQRFFDRPSFIPFVILAELLQPMVQIRWETGGKLDDLRLGWIAKAWTASVGTWFIHTYHLKAMIPWLSSTSDLKRVPVQYPETLINQRVAGSQNLVVRFKCVKW